MQKLFVMSLLVVVLAACATAGRKFDTRHVGDIKTGVQTKQQITDWFGQPYQVTTGLKGHPRGCVERWSYQYAKAVGFGTVTENDVLIVDFNKKDRVCDYAYSSAK